MKRYAVYYAPREGAFADHAAAWLGYDPVTGKAVPQPVLPGIDVAAITRDPRRYGFHGTIRAPFRPAKDVSLRNITQTVAGLAESLPPVVCTGLRLENLHGFVALTPEGCGEALLALAAEVVEATNPLRARLTAAEIARRSPESLTPRERNLLDIWGYPYVMDAFQFHLTLTDRLDAPTPVMAALDAYFAPVLPRPFVIADLCLFGEDDAGFHLLHRYPLTGS